MIGTMANPVANRTLPAEYLRLERAADSKHEFFDGQIYAKAGASRRHVRSNTNLIGALDNALGGQPDAVASNARRRPGMSNSRLE